MLTSCYPALLQVSSVAQVGSTFCFSHMHAGCFYAWHLLGVCLPCGLDAPCAYCAILIATPMLCHVLVLVSWHAFLVQLVAVRFYLHACVTGSVFG
jgi:hypothetical protein